MKYVKTTIVISAITFLGLCRVAQAENSEDIIKGFQGVKPGSANANVCQEKCTGGGSMSSGSCSDLRVYMACKSACSAAYLTECQKTAETQKDYDLVKQYYSLLEKYNSLEEKYKAVNSAHESSTPQEK